MKQRWIVTTHRDAWIDYVVEIDTPNEAPTKGEIEDAFWKAYSDQKIEISDRHGANEEVVHMHPA